MDEAEAEAAPAADPEVPPPPGAPTDWANVVHRGMWTDIQRLGLWKGAKQEVPQKKSPSLLFGAVRPGSLGHGPAPRPIYVVAHGWAPGYRAAVRTAKRRIHWWGPNVARDGERWASDWCWSMVRSSGTWSTPPVVVNPTGMLQQIYDFDHTAEIVAFSWIDDSATDGSYHIDQAYWSEAYTHLNGIRLANALSDAIAGSFFEAGGELRLIGHSHGSRVCTVAAETLEGRGTPATHLTILDSPDDWETEEGNASNMLGYHLDRLTIRDPDTPGPGTYVESYVSKYGAAFVPADPASSVRNVVNVVLKPWATYTDTPLHYGDEHTYAAAWYGGAAAGANERNRLPVGLSWPPVPADRTPALLQRWGGHAEDQWTLAPGTATSTCRLVPHPMTLTEVAASPGVTVAGGTITFTPVAGQAYSTYSGRYPGLELDEYGFAFDLRWTGAPDDALFVVSVEHRTTFGHHWYTLLVLDGASVPAGTRTSIALNSTIWQDPDPVVHMYYRADQNDLSDRLEISNPRWLQVS